MRIRKTASQQEFSLVYNWFLAPSTQLVAYQDLLGPPVGFLFAHGLSARVPGGRLLQAAPDLQDKETDNLI